MFGARWFVRSGVRNGPSDVCAAGLLDIGGESGLTFVVTQVIMLRVVEGGKQT
jgi:hypothetical protein